MPTDIHPERKKSELVMPTRVLSQQRRKALQSRIR